MLFVLCCSEVDNSQSAWNDNSSGEASLLSARKRQIDETSDVVKAELYKSCIEALKPNPDEQLTEDETFGKTMADTLSRFTGLQKAIA